MRMAEPTSERPSRHRKCGRKIRLYFVRKINFAHQRFSNENPTPVGRLDGMDVTTTDDLHRTSALTIAAYDRMAEDYWSETRDRDLQADYELFFRFIEGKSPFTLLDLGCGPGRDLRHFASLGHRALGIDGSARFAAMARAHSGCEVQEQDFLTLNLPAQHFDGIFASASLFHIPPQHLPSVLRVLFASLKPRGILFTLNPRGNDEQGWMGERFCCYHRLATWRKTMRDSGYVELAHAYRPKGLPRARQQWLASVWRKTDE